MLMVSPCVHIVNFTTTEEPPNPDSNTDMSGVESPRSHTQRSCQCGRHDGGGGFTLLVSYSLAATHSAGNQGVAEEGAFSERNGGPEYVLIQRSRQHLLDLMVKKWEWEEMQERIQRWGEGRFEIGGDRAGGEEGKGGVGVK